MDIELLKEFTAIASSASLIDASQKLFVSTSTLSKHLAAIENAVGTELVSRSTTSYGLTRAGEKFLEYAIAICDLYDKALTVPHLAESHSPTVIVGGHLQCSYFYRLFMTASSYAAHYAKPVTPIPLFEHYTAAVPSLAKIDPIRSLVKGTCNMALIFALDDDEVDGFEHADIGTERYSIAIPPDHPLAQHGPYIDIKALEDYRITVSHAYPVIWNRFERLCLRNGFSPSGRKRTFQSGGEMLSLHGGTEIVLLARQDAARIAPEAISGFVIRDLDDDLTLSARAIWRKGEAGEGIPVFLECLQKAQALMELAVPKTTLVDAG